MTSPYWNQAANHFHIFFSTLLVITFICLLDSEVISSASLCILSMILYIPLPYSYTRNELVIHCCIIHGLEKSKICGKLQICLNIAGFFLTEDIIIGNFADLYLSESFSYMLSPQQM